MRYDLLRFLTTIAISDISDHIGKAALDAPEEQRATKEGKDRQHNCKPKHFACQRTVSQHRPTKTFDETDDRIQCVKRVPFRRNQARGIYNRARIHPYLDEEG